MNGTELRHYGVKGMKWGVRRYQNKDGSLTALGKERVSTSSGYDIPKGATAYRAERNESKEFMNRDYTYVNFTDDYQYHSMNTSGAEGFDMGQGRITNDYKLKTTRKLHIASTSDFFNAAMRANNLNPDRYVKDIPQDVLDKGKYAVENRLLEHEYREGTGGRNPLFNNTAKYLKDNGFDGFVDPIDGARQERDGEPPMSMVVFNPKTAFEIVGDRKIVERKQGG